MAAVAASAASRSSPVDAAHDRIAFPLLLRAVSARRGARARCHSCKAGAALRHRQPRGENVTVSARTSLAERSALTGQDLALRCVQFGRRKGPGPRMCVTERDFRLMALLLDVNYLTTSQLVMLGWGASRTRAAQRRLKVLHDAGYLDRFRPFRKVGSAEWIYRLSRKGCKALAWNEMVNGGARYKPAAFTSISYTAHDLQLSAVILRIAIEAGASPTDGILDTMPFTWKGPRSGRIAWSGPRGGKEVHHEHDLDEYDELDWSAPDELDFDRDEKIERSPAAQLPPGTRLWPRKSRSGYLEPDATLIAESEEDRFAVLIEYDRTDRPHKQIDRLRRYDWWLLEGWRQTHFATHSMAPVVIFLTSRERPLRRLVQTAHRTLSAWYGRDHAGPREGVHPAREQILFTSRDRIRSRDWTMDRTPGLPPALREEPGACTPRPLVYDLPAALSRPVAPRDGDQTAVDSAVASKAPEAA